MNIEEFKNIPGFSNYKISKKGEVLFLKKMKIMHGNKDRNGYVLVGIKSDDGFQKQKKVHRLVAEAFLSTFNDNLQVNHLNGIKSDNRVENLEMSTRQTNMDHAKNVLKKTFQRGGVKNSFFKGWIIGTSIKTGCRIIFEGKQSILDAGFNTNCVYDAINGEQKTHKGYRWERCSSAKLKMLISGTEKRTRLVEAAAGIEPA